MATIEEIRAALPKLNPAEDKDWSSSGHPSLARMRVLLKNDKLTQAELDAAAEGARRPDMTKTVNPLEGLQTHQEPDPDKIKEAQENHVIDQWVVATEKGYAAGAVREPGEAFIFSGIMGSWMREEDDDERKAREKARRGDNR